MAIDVPTERQVRQQKLDDALDALVTLEGFGAVLESLLRIQTRLRASGNMHDPPRRVGT